MTKDAPDGSSWNGEMASSDLYNVTSDMYANATANCSVDSPTVSLNTSAPSGSEVERIIRIVVPTLFGVIFLLGLLGNTLVILVVASDKIMRNTTNILILMLALADLFFIVCCVPFTATTYALPIWPFGVVWCKIQQYMIFVCAYASVYTLVLMSLDRYLAVVHAIRSMSIRTERNTWLAVGVTWMLILVGHVPLLTQYDVFNYNHSGEERTTCANVEELKDPYMGKVFYACFITFGYVLPLGAVCLMYGLMLRRLHGAPPGGAKSQESMRAKRRVTKMVVIIVMFFAICWLPIQVILISVQIGIYPNNVFFFGLQVASNCLAYVNSCVNPFLYAFLSENFRRSFRKFLCCSTSASKRAEYELVSVRGHSEAVTTATAIKG